MLGIHTYRNEPWGGGEGYDCRFIPTRKEAVVVMLKVLKLLLESLARIKVAMPRTIR